MNIGDPNLERCNALKKEATALKKTDIDKAISKVNEAIALGADCHDKLSNYLSLAGRHDETINVHKNRFKNDFLHSGLISHQLASIYLKLKDYKNYFYYTFAGLFFDITLSETRSIHNPNPILEHIFKERDILDYFLNSNFSKNLKAIGKADLGKTLNERLAVFLLDDLKENIEKAVSLKVSRNWLKDEEMEYFKVFSFETFDNFYFGKVYPLLFPD